MRGRSARGWPSTGTEGSKPLLYCRCQRTRRPVSRSRPTAISSSSSRLRRGEVDAGGTRSVASTLIQGPTTCVAQQDHLNVLAATQSQTAPPGGVGALSKDLLRARMEETRRRTLSLVAPVTEADLERVHDPLMSPLVWDIGHIAAFEDLWLCARVGGLGPLHPELMDVYDATETPRAHRGELPFLQGDEAFEFMDAVRDRALEVLAEIDFHSDGELLAGAFVWEM